MHDNFQNERVKSRISINRRKNKNKKSVTTNISEMYDTYLKSPEKSCILYIRWKMKCSSDGTAYKIRFQSEAHVSMQIVIKK